MVSNPRNRFRHLLALLVNFSKTVEADSVKLESLSLLYLSLNMQKKFLISETLIFFTFLDFNCPHFWRMTVCLFSDSHG